MSYANAIRQRELMIEEYKKMLQTTDDATRTLDINKQISLLQDEIAQLKIGKPLFGKPTKLTQETRIITADPETKSQKIVVINPHPVEEVVISPLTPGVKGPHTPGVSDSRVPVTRLENDLRKKIQAAKAAKKVN